MVNFFDGKQNVNNRSIDLPDNEHPECRWMGESSYRSTLFYFEKMQRLLTQYDIYGCIGGNRLIEITGRVNQSPGNDPACVIDIRLCSRLVTCSIDRFNPLYELPDLTEGPAIAPPLPPASHNRGSGFRHG